MAAKVARAGDIVVEVGCRCGASLVAPWAVRSLVCGRCRHQGQATGRQFRLGKVGFTEVHPQKLLDAATDLLARHFGDALTEGEAA